MRATLHILAVFLVSSALLFTGACAPTQQRLLDSEVGQLEVRSIQTRVFAINDREKVLRTVMVTLQDLGFMIDSADVGLGTVTATKSDQKPLRFTVSVRPRGQTQSLVRVNAQYDLEPILDPVLYQRFFARFSKAMFLEAQQVE